jgi:hypothetical protein
MSDDDITLPLLTDEQCRDLAREVDLDWHRGFQVCEPENRYAALCRAAVLLDRQRRDKPAAPQGKADAYGYASRLAVAIWEKHSKDAAPQWKPDLMGVLTQIDNMSSGLSLASPPAPGAEPVAWLDESTSCAYSRAELDPGSEVGLVPLYTTPPDHTAAMRQALEALEERYVGALRDSALDALRAALGEKRC